MNNEQEAMHEITAMINVMRLFQDAKMLEMVQLLAADIAAGKTGTLEAVETEMVGWAKQDPANAAYVARLLYLGEFNGPTFFEVEGVPPKTISEKWIYGITPEISPHHPAVSIMINFILAGLDDGLNKDSRTNPKKNRSKSKRVPRHVH